MELTDKNATGNYSKFEFTKGESISVTPQNVASFSSINILWEATGTVDAHEIAIHDNIQIFPNPTKNIFFIRGGDISEIEILNLAGTLVFKNNSTTRIDMSNYKNGIYLVRIKEGNRTVVKKLVKE
jgi:arabinogalactan endo-1,4-beta-galactosidase